MAIKIDRDIWGDEHRLMSVFSWLTRTGIGLKFGSIPIGWYQSHQVCAVDVLEAKARLATGTEKGEPFEVKGEKRGSEYDIFVRRPKGAGWHHVGSARSLYTTADRCARGDRKGAGLEGLKRKRRK